MCGVVLQNTEISVEKVGLHVFSNRCFSICQVGAIMILLFPTHVRCPDTSETGFH